MAYRYNKGGPYNKASKFNTYKTHYPGTQYHAQLKPISKEEMIAKVNEKTYRMMNCVAFSTYWSGNYCLLLVADRYFGFGYGQPLTHGLFWRRAKHVSEHLHERLLAGEDKTAFAFWDYLGSFATTEDLIVLDRVEDVIRMLDWGRNCTDSQEWGTRISDTINAIRGGSKNTFDAVNDICRMVPVTCTVPDQVSGMAIDSLILPHNVWTLMEAQATAGDFALAGIAQPWNVTIPVEEARRPSQFTQNTGPRLPQAGQAGIVLQSGQQIPQGSQGSFGQTGFGSSSQCLQE
jgi:hypothetical protein